MRVVVPPVFSSHPALVASANDDPRHRTDDHPGVTSACAWLTSPQLESHVTHAMAELQDVLRGSLEMSRQDTSRDDRGVGQLTFRIILYSAISSLFLLLPKGSFTLPDTFGSAEMVRVLKNDGLAPINFVGKLSCSRFSQSSIKETYKLWSENWWYNHLSSE